ncbi:MAG TPA: hypothetical protein VJJ75_02005 [Candidatus Nanoarchaeia archaeon]|nr:hypothetical protein [Candidatus Nanoarchaeia archaeon]
MVEAVEIYSSHKLDDLCKGMAGIEPDWDDLFCNLALIHGSGNKEYRELSDYMGRLTEFHLDNLIEGSCMVQGVEIGHPLEIQENGLSLAIDANGRHLISIKDGKCENKVHEYDKIVVLEGIPVNFEISIGRCLRNMINSDIVYRRLETIARLLGTDKVGYVAVMPLDYYEIFKMQIDNGWDEKTRRHRRIFNNGAKVVPLYACRNKILVDLEKQVRIRIKKYYNNGRVVRSTEEAVAKFANR